MLKNILKLKGAQKLSKNEQKSINGGDIPPILCEDGCVMVAPGVCDCRRRE